MQGASKKGKDEFLQNLNATRDAKATSALWQAREISNELKVQLDQKIAGILVNSKKDGHEFLKT